MYVLLIFFFYGSFPSSHLHFALFIEHFTFCDCVGFCIHGSQPLIHLIHSLEQNKYQYENCSALQQHLMYNKMLKKALVTGKVYTSIRIGVVYLRLKQ